MDIGDIKQYAEQEILAFDAMDDLEREEYEMSPLALAHLRMRQLLLVASIAESLAGLNVGRLNARVAAIEEAIEGFEEAMEEVNKIADSVGAGPLPSSVKRIEALERQIKQIKEAFPERFA